MRIIRWMLLGITFVMLVFMASANTHSVDLHLWPEVGVEALSPPTPLTAPLFLIILGCLLVGVLVGGVAALLEQGRLRWGLRRANKESKRLRSEITQVGEQLEAEKEQAEQLRDEVARLTGDRDDTQVAVEEARTEAQSLRRRLDDAVAATGTNAAVDLAAGAESADADSGDDAAADAAPEDDTETKPGG